MSVSLDLKPYVLRETGLGSGSDTYLASTFGRASIMSCERQGTQWASDSVLFSEDPKNNSLSSRNKLFLAGCTLLLAQGKRV